MKIKKYFHSIAQYTPQFIVLLSVLTSNVFVPSMAIAEEISDLQGTNTHLEEEIPIDDSEDILEEGISTSIYEEEVLETEDEETVPEEPIEGETENTSIEIKEEPIEVIKYEYLTDDSAIIDTNSSDWFISDEMTTTKDNVRIGIKYVFPLDNDVNVKFTKLPYLEEDRSPLTIKTVDPEDLPEQFSNMNVYVVDVSTKMVEGEFEYVLTLPKVDGDYLKVFYIDDVTKDVVFSEDFQIKGETVERKLDHMSQQGLSATTIQLVESTCGNNTKEVGEECDGSDLGGLPSSDFTCKANCTLDLVEPKVRICHASSSHTKPYIENEPSKSADLHGHDGHDGPIWFPGITEVWGDIIPPFYYIGGYYDGKNWNTEGQMIYNNGCEIPQTGTLTICKYNDIDMDGLIDDEDPLIHWDIKIIDLDGPDAGETWFTATPNDECLTLNDFDFGEYEITESDEPGWEVSYLGSSENYTITLDYFNPDQTVNFLNYEIPDTCGNGVLNDNEQCDYGELNGQSICSDSCTLIRKCLREMATNGGFELPNVSDSSGWDIFPYNEVPGWSADWYSTATSYGGQTRPETPNIELHAGVNGWTSSDDQYIELDSDWDGPIGTLHGEPASLSIYQNIPVLYNNEYKISWTYSPRPNHHDNRLELQVNDVQVFDSGVIAGGGSVNWVNESYTFVSDSDGIVNIKFNETGSPDSRGMFLNNVKIECLGEIIPSCVEEGPVWADKVQSYSQGTLYNGNPITDPNRIDPNETLGAPDDNFYSLGKGGEIILDFYYYIPNIPGDDLSVHEITWSRTSDIEEKAEVWVKNDHTDWIYLGEASSFADGDGDSKRDGNNYFDLSSIKLPWINSVKLVESSIGQSIHDDGFDLDAVDATYRVCDEPQPFCGDGVINQKDEYCDGRDGVIRGQNFCTYNCELIPIYDGEHSCPDNTKPIFRQSININGNDLDGETISLKAGGQYLFEASGEYNANSTWKADAGYSTIDDWSSNVPEYGIWGTPPHYGAHALLADFGMGVGVVQWDDDDKFNTIHKYSKYYEPTNSEVQFVIGDRYGNWFNTQWDKQIGMKDNSGSLKVDVYECLTPPKYNCNETIYAVNNQQSLSWIDSTDGTNNSFSTLKFGSSASADHPYNEETYYIERYGSDLAYYNHATETHMEVGTTGVSDSFFTKLAFDLYGDLYGLTDKHDLYIININNGVATKLGSITGIDTGADIIFDDNNTLYLLDRNGSFFTVDLFSLTKTLIKETGLANVTGLAYLKGVFYVSTAINGSTQSDIYSMNKSGESITKLNTEPQPIINDLSSCLPGIPQTDIRICKEDDNGKRLDGWDIILASEPVQGPTPINVSNSNGTDSIVLPKGSYLIKISGTYRYGNSEMNADAGYSYRPMSILSGCDCWLSGLDLPSGTGLMARINDTTIDWGVYNESNEYLYTFDNTSKGSVNISIIDNVYGDNVNDNNFQFEIFELVAQGETEEGCVEFEDIYYGSYYLDEFLQEYFIRQSGTGIIEVNEESTEFVIINEDRTPYCGDEILNQESEECDGVDGVTAGYNFCTPTCKLIPIYDGDHSCDPGTTPVKIGDTYSIDSKESDGIQIDLEKDKEYLFKVSGIYLFGTNSNRQADAAYGTENSWDSTRDDLGIFGTNYRGVLSVLANLGRGIGVVEWDDDTDWKTNEIPHVYQKSYTPTENIKAQFLISDWYDEWYRNRCDNQSCMGDNSGALELEVYECQEFGSIQGSKYYDVNNNGDFDEVEKEEPGDPNRLDGWTIELYDDSWNLYDSMMTGDDNTPAGNVKKGQYRFVDVVPGTYHVCEVIDQDGWYQTEPSSGITYNENHCHTVTVDPGDEVKGIQFGNNQGSDVTVCKYDNEDNALEGWEVILSNPIDQLEVPTIFNPAVATISNGTNGVIPRGLRGTTLEDGCITFNNIKYGTYILDEVMQRGWRNVSGLYDVVSVDEPIEQYTLVNELIRYDIHGYKWHDINGNGDNGDGRRDCINPELNGSECDLEPMLPKWRIFIDEGDGNGTWDEGEQFTFTDDGEYYGKYRFEGLLPGEYTICEEIPEDWAQTFPGNPVSPQCHTISLPNGCIPQYDDVEKLATENGFENVECELNFGNIQESVLYVSETNDSWPNTLNIGDTFTYTITVRADKGSVKGVTLVNLPPEGFTPQSGTFSAISSNPLHIIDTSLVTYASPGEWDLGDLEKGEVITITYTALVTGTVDAGIYPDLTYAEGQGVKGTTIYALSEGSGFAIDDGIVNENVVGTQVKVEEELELDEGEVLGAATSIELPATGASTVLTIGAIISAIIGLILVLFNSKKKISILIIFATLAFGLFTLVSPKPVNAQMTPKVTVKIEQPETPTDKTAFNIGYVALPIPLTTPLEVQCYEETYGMFGPVYTTGDGNCVVDETVITDSGTYTFWVEVTPGCGTTVQSEKVTVVVDLDTPEAVEEYDKDEGTCKYVLSFKTADDGRTSSVEIFRSDKQPFTANEDTRIHSMSVDPNKEYTYTDDNLPSCDKEYYYAVRAVDDLNNRSPFTTDDIVTIVETETATEETATGGTTEQGEVAGEETEDTEVGEDEDGEVAGEETEDSEKVDGEDTEDGEEGEGDGKEKTFWQKYWFILVAGIILTVFVGYTYVRRRE